MYEFEVLRPKTIAEAVAALQSEEAMALGGGQTLIPTLKQRLAMPETLVSLSGIAEMIGVRNSKDAVIVGGATTHAQVAREAAYPALAAMAGKVGDPAVRNRGTAGGSIANNDPSADYPAAVLASNATITTNSRDIAAADFFQGLFSTALEEGEIITSIKFPIPEKAAFQKFAQPASRFALVAVFVAKFADGVRVAVTGAAEDGVFRWGAAEQALEADFSAEAVKSLQLPDTLMIGDMHGTPQYRASLVRVLTARAVAAA